MKNENENVEDSKLKFKDLFEKEKIDKLLITILKNEKTGIKIKNIKEARVLCELFDQLGLTYNDGTPYKKIIGKTSSKRVVYNTRLSTKINSYTPSFIYLPLQGSVVGVSRHYKSIDYNQFLIKVNQYLTK